jgi:hypothetical protein
LPGTAALKRLGRRDRRYGGDMTSTTSRTRVLVLGGGFGGMYTARRLERRLSPDEAEITLINPEN